MSTNVRTDNFKIYEIHIITFITTKFQPTDCRKHNT